MTESPKTSKATPTQKQSLSPGDLKDRLPEIETQAIEIEKELRKILALEKENDALQERLKNLNRAVFSILYHAARPNDPRFVESYLVALAEGLERLNEKRSG